MPGNHAQIVIRSREFGDGSEYDMDDSQTASMIPDHYVKRFWRKAALPISGGTSRTVQFINKDPDSRDRSVAFSTLETGGIIKVTSGGYNEGGNEIATLQLGSGKGAEKSAKLTMGGKTGAVKDMLKKTNHMSTSRSFTGPDGISYKWKVIWVGNDPAFPEATFRELYTKDSPHPLATTARLNSRDGNMNEEAYPVYVAERGLAIQSFIIATLVVLDAISA
ncbi:hypothetical protein CYLTODRAFT_494127 [Cylindrobasidium torrendii FP15055 ss-10]|uniref:DUF6593 domain-containing protein n=1 Tax=Cylindrobasidium torrendii FP15055 ss-10 TaxID=1314674 RepID=A0A0D7AXP7_9AGAR|nr:hypothetical protein CYLTODRAFT_494127 [Cylindrobasidium torrendii FP15055 ss-10]